VDTRPFFVGRVGPGNEAKTRLAMHETFALCDIHYCDLEPVLMLFVRQGCCCLSAVSYTGLM